MNLIDRIEDGLAGKYSGLNNGFDRINNYVFGIQKKTYYLIEGNSGVGKSTFLDFILLNAIQDAKNKNIPIKVFYYSFEIDKLSKMCNWLTSTIHNKYDIVISPEKIKGLGNNRLSQEEYRIIQKELPDIEKLFSEIKFIFQSSNPTGIYNELYNYAANNGEIIYENYTTSTGEEKKRMSSYIPKEDEYRIVVMDHLYHLHKERGYSTKEVIDKMSEYAVFLRNMFGYSFIFVQQFNQSLSSTERLKFKGADLSPQQSDFRDSTNPYNDADIVLGLMNPYKLDMNTCMGYDVRKLGQSFIQLKIIKNRLSKDNIGIGLYFNPSAGSFVELEKSDKIDYSLY